MTETAQLAKPCKASIQGGDSSPLRVMQRLDARRLQQHQRDLALGVALVDVISTTRAAVDQRGESSVVCVHEWPQPVALLG
jgi:hypothetical protein